MCFLVILSINMTSFEAESTSARIIVGFNPWRINGRRAEAKYIVLQHPWVQN